MKIKMNPQEFISIIIQAITTTFLTAKGIDQRSAEFTGNCIGGIVKGLSLADQNPADQMKAILQKAVDNMLLRSDITLPDDCYDLLKDSLTSSNMIWEYICAPNTKEALRKYVIKVCNQSIDCDTTTLQANEIVENIMSYIDDMIIKNPDLQLYTIYQWVRKQNSQPTVYTANENYAQSFVEPLFLHKEKKNTKVNLLNLFVPQKYCDSDGTVHDDLKNALVNFINNNTTNLLFIEGDGGSGKTTLVSWMNYHYSVGDKIAEKLYKSRPLITIRLRDLNKKDVVPNKDLWLAIRNYMRISSLDELESLYPNAVVILDGFDELCMIEGLHDYEELIYNIVRCELKNWKFIITTRPKFIYRDIIFTKLQYELNHLIEYIYLQHFDQEKRVEWLKHYTLPDYCGEHIDDFVKNYILGIDTDSDSCISDTPMTLYMLAAKNTTVEMLENNWYLYHHIFYYDLSETEYNKMIPDPNRRYAHSISQIRDAIYQVSEEIAYCMYRQNNQNFYLKEDTLRCIIQQLSDRIPTLRDADMKSVLERSYALCCYWKTNSDRGAVEFLHNNIRDFFLAEKIYRSLNQLIMDFQGIVRLNSAQKKQIVSNLCSIFQYGTLDTKVTEFILLRAIYYSRRHGIDFSKIEYEKHILSSTAGEILSNKEYYKELLNCDYDGNLLQLAINVITCIVQVCRYVCEPYLSRKNKIPWQFDDYISIIFKDIFSQVPITLTSDSMIALGSRGRFSGLHLKGCDLRNIGFQYSVLSGSDLSDTVLCGCDFTSSNLDSVDFTNADMHYACLKSAKLTNSIFTGVDLRGTDLPDGFCSMDQNEQIQHLKSLKIQGLRI